MPGFTMQRTVSLPFAQALERYKAALQDEGFGVLYEIDFSGIIAAKTGQPLSGRVTGLGVCDPRLARQALEVDRALAALLPCGAFVAETDGGSLIGLLDPEAALGLAGRAELEPLGRSSRERLGRALEAL